MPKEEDFIKVIKENEGLLFKITSLYTDTKIDAEDLRQEIVYQLWKSFDSFSGKSKRSTWMYRVALNTALVYLKKKNRIKIKPGINEQFLQRIDPIDTVMEERVKTLYKVIKKLNKIERSIILLYLEGKNYEEIAEITGFTKTNIGTRINRIKTKLKSFIKN